MVHFSIPKEEYPAAQIPSTTSSLSSSSVDFSYFFIILSWNFPTIPTFSSYFYSSQGVNRGYFSISRLAFLFQRSRNWWSTCIYRSMLMKLIYWWLFVIFFQNNFVGMSTHWLVLDKIGKERRQKSVPMVNINYEFFSRFNEFSLQWSQNQFLSQIWQNLVGFWDL